MRWYASHRLAEIAFHAWDLHVSLGQQSTMDKAVAGLLLPTLLESNAPRTYAAGLSAERGSGERYRLTVVDDSSASWLVKIDPEQLTASPGDDAADLTIVGPASALALLVYGRAELTSLTRSGVVHAEGDPGLVERFGLIFPRP